MSKRSFNRLLACYASLTAGLWLISASMTSNGYDFESNLAWKIVSIARNVLTGIGVAALLFWQFGLWLENYAELERRRRVRDQNKKREEEMSKAILERLSKNIEYEKERRVQKRKDEEQRVLRIKIEKKQGEEKRKQEEADRRLRSADEAAQKAFEDFI